MIGDGGTNTFNFIDYLGTRGLLNLHSSASAHPVGKGGRMRQFSMNINPQVASINYSRRLLLGHVTGGRIQ